MPMSPADIDKRLKHLSGWERLDVNGRPMLQKTFRTGNFLNGLAFLTRVAVLAEGMNHHPDVTFTYPRVILQLTTHDAGGLTEKDFDLANRIDELK